MQNNMAELIPINVVVADRTYRLKVEPKDEEMIRKTAKLINDKVLEFKNKFAGKDTQDYVSMVLLWFATEQTKSTSDIIQQQETASKLASLETQLDKILSDQSLPL
ncbi:cell division protein ZapA [mine drainage metagenome]|uniref:Cell division protein ZapA n=1 Tax=mine drainage metagenome TaxID=410659 RepID=A0A1J5SVZ7_9ZZZZ